MTLKKENAAGGGVSESSLGSRIKKKGNGSASSSQEPILWQARCESYQRMMADPSPVNMMADRIIAAAWQAAFVREVCP